MGDLNDLTPKTLNIFGAGCIAAEMFPNFIRPDEAHKVSDMCRHDRELYIRCRDCEIKAFIEEAEGLDLHTVRNLQRISLELPFFIPIAESSFFQTSLEIGAEVIGLQLRDTVKKRSGVRGNIVRDSPLLRCRQVIQFSSGRDDLLEPIWAQREELAWFETMAGMGLTASTGMNFSVYECMCPFGQHLNIKKSLLSASLMQAAGVPAIPHFYGVSDNQRQRAVRWLNENPQIRFVSINCQSQKDEHDVQVVKDSIVYLLENSNHEIHIILEGFRIPWLEGLYQYLPYLHIAQKQPFMDGLGYRAVDFNPATEHFAYDKDYKADKRQLVERSIRARREYLEHLQRKHAAEFVMPLAWLHLGALTSHSQVRG